MNVPEDLYYSKNHEWARLEDDGTVTVGITDYAQGELTDVVYLELPELGKEVEADDDVAVAESVKGASEIYAPIAGEILAVNEQAVEDPAIINGDPYGDGWLFKLRVSDTSGLKELMNAEAYKELLS